MKSYWADELSFDIPEGFEDRTAHVLEWMIDGGTMSLTIQRDATQTRKSPQEMEQALRAEFEKRFPHFFPEEPLQLDLDLDHSVLMFRWMRDGQAVLQVQVLIELGDRLVIMMASGLAKSRSHVTQLILDATRSLELRTP